MTKLFRGEMHKTQQNLECARNAADRGDWLETERALHEVQLGARLLREMRLKGMFKGSAPTPLKAG